MSGEAQNSCSESVYAVGDLELLRRYLMLGNENGSYYVKPDDLASQHASCVERLIASDPDGALAAMEDLQERVYKKDYLLAALARFCVAGPQRKRSYGVAMRACRTPTHLFQFIDLYEKACKAASGSTGWNRMHKEAVCGWYMDKPALQLAYLVTKYRNRSGWTHTDVLRLAHPNASGSLHDLVFAYVTRGQGGFHDKAAEGLPQAEQLKEYIDAVEAIGSTDLPEEAAALIERFGLVREHVPTGLLSSPEVWRALSKKMPMVALMRNLNKLSAVGAFLDYPDVLESVVGQLTSEEAVVRSGVHPLQALVALNTYSKGKGEKGSLTWTPHVRVTAALESAFRLAFKNVEPTNKRLLLALDVSGSMTWTSVCGIEGLMASQVAVAMATVFLAREPSCTVMGFAETFRELDITKDRSVQDNMARAYTNTFGNTDVALPFDWALKNEKAIDAFVVFTDSETNCGRSRPADALRSYRAKTGIDAKLVVVGLSSNRFTVADPNDRGMMDIAGFDPDAPAILRDFLCSAAPCSAAGQPAPST